MPRAAPLLALVLAFLAPHSAAFAPRAPPTSRLQRTFTFATPPNTPRAESPPVNDLRTRVDSLQRETHDLRMQVRRLHGIIQAIAGAIVFSDDMALRERETMLMHFIYMDVNVTATRAPVLMRRAVNDALADYDMHPTPVPKRGGGNFTLGLD